MRESLLNKYKYKWNRFFFLFFINRLISIFFRLLFKIINTLENENYVLK